jgi:hypothetical protein
LRHGTKFPPSKIKTLASQCAAVPFGDHPTVDGGVECTNTLPELSVVFTIYHGAQLLSPPSPFSRTGIILVDI